jgi:small-conductance mechanosensitive channel
LKRYFWFLRGSIAAIILLHWVVGTATPLATLSYDLLAVVSFAWVVIFWRSIKPVVATGVRHGEAAPDPKGMFLLKAWSYLVFGGFMISNMAGYGFLAEHWFTAWIKTVALLLWGLIIRKAIWEWEQDHRALAVAGAGKQPPGSAYHLRWSLIQIVWLLWLIVLVAGGVSTWDKSGFLLPVIKRFIGHTFTIGSLELSINGVISAAIILFVTHVSVRVGRTIIREKVLDRKVMERGLKHSIMTITGYLGWAVGLVLALGTLGVNSTSLAVVFGALSIGIGFGLQTIFNNFISGLILLFERPIQVGDFVEVNGLWAEVKKINVRATVVQTFDNASVIIPNSELVSQQVTNWSFKDQRMRRNLEVGVAYGSDIEKVTSTLLEIAQEHRFVLKYPKPEVLFIDHADSALIFRLRVWLSVDDYWGTASQIRTEIDRRFREQGIEIAFPQRDVHIRTIVGGNPPAQASVKD